MERGISPDDVFNIPDAGNMCTRISIYVYTYIYIYTYVYIYIYTHAWGADWPLASKHDVGGCFEKILKQLLAFYRQPQEPEP